MSSFDGVDLFGSGPHAFRYGRRGHLVVPDLSLGGLTPTRIYLGLLELEIRVSGILVSTTQAGLDGQRTAIMNRLTDPPVTGTLVGENGESWADMGFLTYEEGEPTGRGRRLSVAYEAMFLRGGSPFLTGGGSGSGGSGGGS